MFVRDNDKLDIDEWEMKEVSEMNRLEMSKMWRYEWNVKLDHALKQLMIIQVNEQSISITDR